MSEFHAGFVVGALLVGLTWVVVALNDGSGWAVLAFVSLGLVWLSVLGLMIGTPKDHA